ncbi:hypothetical protein ACJMK2_000547 [Sinanodonta woodiana]|uniref:C-type lectin domain-containing protein n=1 Tax=Sinanodonta woodiana TaxID=1069815 RepID=A0ABD3XRY5_SINWO
MNLGLKMASVFNFFSCVIFLFGNSLCVDNLTKSCSNWEEDHDSVNNLDASVSLWERNDCPSIDCAIRCDRDPSCRSFFHHPTYEKCLASSSYKRGLPTDKAGQQGWVYYTKKQYCDQGYSFNQSLSLCYKLYLIELSFNDAMIKCEKDGAKLMTINNEAEFRFIKEVMKNGWPPRTVIGLRAVGANREWKTWNGQTAPYLYWGIDQPDNNDGMENCVELMSDEYNDFPCFESKQFVCQRFI